MVSELIFKAMGDTTRLRLLQVLWRHELSVSEIVEVLGQPQSTVSRHLRVLREADLIVDRRDGTNVLYTVAEAGPNDQGESLQATVLNWVSQQPEPKAIAGRLKQVLERRSAESISFFESLGQRWDQMRIECFGDRFHLEALTALLPRDWVVADIGTGTGYLLGVLAGCFRQVIAVDPAETMLDVARSRQDLAELANVDFRQGDLSRLPIPDQHVDLALAILVLHHVPSPVDALAELRRVVRPSGHVLIVEQAAHELAEFHERMQDRWWGFEPQWLAERVSAAGFAAVDWRRLDSAEPTSASAPQAPDVFVLTAGPEPVTKTGRGK